jgi:hypothetical protein
MSNKSTEFNIAIDKSATEIELPSISYEDSPTAILKRVLYIGHILANATYVPTEKTRIQKISVKKLN